MKECENKSLSWPGPKKVNIQMIMFCTKKPLEATHLNCLYKAIFMSTHDMFLWKNKNKYCLNITEYFLPKCLPADFI